MLTLYDVDDLRSWLDLARHLGEVREISGAPNNVSELGYAGVVRGRPIDVIRGELTGVPIPASAEIVVEGWLCEPRPVVNGADAVPADGRAEVLGLNAAAPLDRSLS